MNTLFEDTAIPNVINPNREAEHVQIYPLKTIQSATIPPQRISSFEIIWIKGGANFMQVDLQKFIPKQNTIYCLTPGQFRCLELSGNADGYYISLSPEFMNMSNGYIDFSIFENYSAETAGCPNAEMEELIVRMAKECPCRDEFCLEILKGLLKAFVVYLKRYADAFTEQKVIAGNDKEILRKFMLLLKKSIATKKLVSDYADALCMTPNYLNAVVKKQTGFPASYHIQQFIIMEAKRQALYSNMRMKEVADSLGFDDYAHFSRFFKNYSGMNFSAFRKGVR